MVSSYLSNITLRFRILRLQPLQQLVKRLVVLCRVLVPAVELADEIRFLCANLFRQRETHLASSLFGFQISLFHFLISI